MAITDQDIDGMWEVLAQATETDDIARCAHDLADAGCHPAFFIQVVSVQGDRLDYHINVATDHLIVDAVNGIRNPVLCDHYQKILTNKECKAEPFKFLKHKNDMSPEEYKWCCL